MAPMKMETVQGTWPDTVYIIGGGPSLKGFDFDRLKDRFTIGVNRAAWLADTSALFTMDQHFVRMRRDRICSYIDAGGSAYLCMPANVNNHKEIPQAHYIMHDRGPGLSKDPSRIYGVNSGYAALGLCYHKRAPKVYLLGFDFMPGNDGQHWHSGYPWQNKTNARYFDRWAGAFDAAARDALEVGMKVTNVVGPRGSLVQSFPTMRLEEL